MNRLHFCGGIPRSGSTILMNILQQNPKIFTTGTCALKEIICNHILIQSRYKEPFQAMSVEQADKAMYGLIHGATRGWFEALTDKPTVISKNRGWSDVSFLYPKSKYIVMVRDLRDVVESFEAVNNKTLALRAYGNNNVITSSMHVHERYSHYFIDTNSLSSSLNYEIPRMIEMFQQDKSKVIFIRYEDFTKNPIGTLKDLYYFLEEDWFEHNLNKIEQSFLFEHDHAYFRERVDHKTISNFRYHSTPIRKLSKVFHDRVVEENKWFYECFYLEELKNG